MLLPDQILGLCLVPILPLCKVKKVSQSDGAETKDPTVASAPWTGFTMIRYNGVTYEYLHMLFILLIFTQLAFT